MRTWANGLIAGLLAAALSSTAALGQSQDGAEAGEAGEGVTKASGAQTGETSDDLGIVAVQRAAQADKYLFIVFFRSDDEQTRQMRETLESAVGRVPDKATSIAVDVADPLEKELVGKFGVSRAPMPLILAAAPNGAITRSWFRNFNAEQLDQAFVSPGESQCLKALQERKLVLLCVQNGSTADNDEAMQGVNEFRMDQRYARATAVVSIDPTDEAEAAFLGKVRVDPKTAEAVTVVLAPPGRAVGSFTGATTKATLVAAVQKAGSSCTPGAGCCPAKKPAAARGNAKSPSGQRPDGKKNP